MKWVASNSGKRILFVMATEVEYGPHLKQRFAPLITGVGPVEGAVVLTAALADLKSQSQLPDIVVSIGSAGSRILEQGEVYQATLVAYRDMDASAIGFERGRTPMLDLPVQVALPFHINGIKTATLSSGATVVSGEGYNAIAEDMVDMETFAHMRACDHFGLPLIALRGISDGAEELQHYGSWADALPALDQHLANAVDLVLAKI
jgi:adenosylhomocysteine nucleosidase